MGVNRRAAGRGASVRSRFALNAVNFFLAQLTGIGSPYLSALLQQFGWPYAAIGVAVAMPAAGVLVAQSFAGMILDRWYRPRAVLALSSLVVGLGYAVLPHLMGAPRAAIDAVLFTTGLAQSFFAPLLAGLALGLVGHGRLDRTMGVNQAWNHLGDVAAALVIFVVLRGGLANVFYTIGVVALLAGASGFAIRADEIAGDTARGGTERCIPLRTLLRSRPVSVLLASTTLFQACSSSVLPFVTLRVKDLGGSNVQIALLVLVSQASMTLVSLATGLLLDRWGRKLVFAVGFAALPVYILLCGLVEHPIALIMVQAVGGVGAGIFGVAIIAVSADLTRGTGHFHAFTGISRATYAAGAIAGPLAMGSIVGRHGYPIAFTVLAFVAVASAILFVAGMPETRPAGRLVAAPHPVEPSG